MENNFQFKVGDVKYYASQDFSNVTRVKEIDGEEFKKLIEKTFKNYTAKPVSTTGWGSKEYLTCNEVCEIVPDKKRPQTVFYNKGMICIREATTENDGIGIGIHDFNTVMYSIKYVA